MEILCNGIDYVGWDGLFHQTGALSINRDKAALSGTIPANRAVVVLCLGGGNMDVDSPLGMPCLSEED